ncbi:unnamed protein product [Mortierella alpina]
MRCFLSEKKPLVASLLLLAAKRIIMDLLHVPIGDFILDLIAIFEVINSNRSVTSKLLWSLLIFLFPILGLIIYFLFGGREEHNSGYEVIA